MKKIYLILITSLITFNLHAQVDRIVFWLHGLGGDNAAFSRVATATTFNTSTLVPAYPPRKIWSEQLGYEQQTYNLDNAAAYIHTKIAAADGINSTFGLTTKSNNFIIAHSQGGLVARSVDRLYTLNPWLERRINGIVTFGSAHQGAQIINSRANNLFPGFIDDACNDLTIGPIQEGINQNFLLRWFISASNVQNVLQPLCTVLSGTVPLAFTDFSQPISNDYMVGAPALADLNNFQSSVNKVAFYGIEDEQTQVWRVLTSLKNKPNNYPAFEADDDTELLTAANENLLKYQTKVTYWQNQYNNLASAYCNWWTWLISPTFCVVNDATVNNRRDGALNTRNAWQQGVNWWVTGNDRFRLLTGALSYQPVTTISYECECHEYDYYGNPIDTWITHAPTPSDCQLMNTWNGTVSCYSTGNTVTYDAYELVSKPSDGIVLAESASNFPGCNYTKEMIGSNHQQMRNDNNTKQRLLELFRGDYGFYFKTDAR